MNSNTTSTTSTTSSASLLLELLSRPSTSSAPPPTWEQLLPSTPSTPTTEPVVELIDMTDEREEHNIRLISTAHPNFHDPELREQCIRDLMDDTLPSDAVPQDEELSSLWEDEDVKRPSQPLSPLPPTPRPTTPPSPISSSPSLQLPVRRKELKGLHTNTTYKVHSWEKIGNQLRCTIFNRENTELYAIVLPNNFRRPPLHLRLHHLFEANLYLNVSKINGKLNFTFRT